MEKNEIYQKEKELNFNELQDFKIIKSNDYKKKIKEAKLNFNSNKNTLLHKHISSSIFNKINNNKLNAGNVRVLANY